MEYRIYRGTQPGVYDPQALTPTGFLDTVFVDSSIQSNIDYYYVITSVNILDIEGGYSQEVSINTGQPQTPTGLSATPGNTEVGLTWNNNPDPDILGYIIYRATNPDSFSVIDTSLNNTYTDLGLTNGIDYFYYITAVDSFQNVSFNSDTVSATPMGFDSGILLVNSNISNLQINPDYDSMVVFYENILQNYQHAIIDSAPTELTEFAPYSTIVFCKEMFYGPAYFNAAFRDLYERYLNAGGNIIVAGHRQLIYPNVFIGYYNFDQNDFRFQYLNLNGLEYPHYFENTEFSGGTSASVSFNDFVLDSTRISRIVFPSGGVPDGRLNGIGALDPIDNHLSRHLQLPRPPCRYRPPDRYLQYRCPGISSLLCRGADIVSNPASDLKRFRGNARRYR
jgi:hypothetical protein